MTDPKNINIEEYKYDLPEERIAKYPLKKRDSSKLLVYRGGEIKDDQFFNIGSYIDSSKTLIFNNTKVIRARLLFKKSTGATIEIFCLEPHLPADYEQSLTSRERVEWRCIVGNLKKWKEGVLKMNISVAGSEIVISAKRIRCQSKDEVIQFYWNNSIVSFSEILESIGHMPVPPYLNRSDEPIDILRYQTIYSSTKGSVAAPTAGLHFSEEVLSDLKEKKIDSDEITLHVGAGTFVPVKSATIGEHKMHNEHFFVTRECVKSLITKEIIAVGTTSVRTLETLYHLGIKLLKGDTPSGNTLELTQWEPYNSIDDIPPEVSLNALVTFMENRELDTLHASTSVIIVPGYKFRIVKGIITNYHLPASTLLLLVSAFIGENWRRVYNHALSNEYRFLSYGDSSLLLP